MTKWMTTMHEKLVKRGKGKTYLTWVFSFKCGSIVRFVVVHRSCIIHIWYFGVVLHTEREVFAFLFAQRSQGWFITLIGKTLRALLLRICQWWSADRDNFNGTLYVKAATNHHQICATAGRSWLYLWHDYCFRCHLDIGWFMDHKV